MAPKSTKRKRSRSVGVEKEKDNVSSITDDSQTLMPYLCTDIWFEILSWVCSTWLRCIVSHVCKTWHTMIRQPYFVETNLLRSKSSNYVIQNEYGRLYCVDLYSDYLETRPLNHRRLSLDIDFLPGMMHSTSQGLCIFNVYRSYYVVNPLTQQRHDISHIDGLMTTPRSDFSYSAVRDRRSGEVKLVLAFLQYNHICSWYVQKLGSQDWWKPISKGNKFGKLEFPGISIAGFVIYLVCDAIVVLDVSLETIRKIDCPTKVQPVTYLQMGTNVLSCISHDHGLLYIHVLNEFVAAKWSLYKIVDYGSLLGVAPEYHQFLGWIRSKKESLTSSSLELFVRLDKSAASDSCYKFPVYNDKWTYLSYNLKTKCISYLLGVGYSWKYMKSGRLCVHTPSFVSW